MNDACYTIHETQRMEMPKVEQNDEVINEAWAQEGRRKSSRRSGTLPFPFILTIELKNIIERKCDVVTVLHSFCFGRSCSSCDLFFRQLNSPILQHLVLQKEVLATMSTNYVDDRTSEWTTTSFATLNSCLHLVVEAGFNSKSSSTFSSMRMPSRNSALRKRCC